MPWVHPASDDTRETSPRFGLWEPVVGAVSTAPHCCSRSCLLVLHASSYQPIDLPSCQPAVLLLSVLLSWLSWLLSNEHPEHLRRRPQQDVTQASQPSCLRHFRQLTARWAPPASSCVPPPAELGALLVFPFSNRCLFKRFGLHSIPGATELPHSCELLQSYCCAVPGPAWPL